MMSGCQQQELTQTPVCSRLRWKRSKDVLRKVSIPVASVTILVAIICSAQLPAQACRPVYTRFGMVCKCTESYCDPELKFDWPSDDTTMVKLVSDEAGARFQLSTVPLRPAASTSADATSVGDGADFRVTIDINRHRQQVAGYGAAFTDSASMLIKERLSEKCREQLMRDYFAPTGLNYNLARVPIGGTDMSWRPYSYNDLATGEEDFELSKFSLQREDLDYKLPMIRWARSLRPAASAAIGGQPLRLLASSWSAPNWMKSNHKLVQGRLKDKRSEISRATTRNAKKATDSGYQERQRRHHNHNLIDGEYYDAYARYIIRFLDEYEHQLNMKPDSSHSPSHSNATTQQPPFKFWALTPQNEPCTPGRLGLSVVNFNSVNFSPEQIGRFVRAHLVPNLLESNRTARDMALFVWDDTILGLDNYKDHLFRMHQRRASEMRRRTDRANRHKANDLQDTASDRDDDDAASANTDDDHKTASNSSGTSTANAEYVRGLAIHWYSQGLDRIPYSALYELRRWLPHQYSLISTEASFIGRPQPGNWTRGERYARDIIMNLRAGSLGWIDWNLALNLEGGPTWSRNFLDAAVLVDEQSGSYLKNPMFYAIGHLSRFIQAGSRILHSQLAERVTIGELDNNKNSSSSTPMSWRRVDELGEQTSELLVVASELAHTPQAGSQAQSWRQIALVLLNRDSAKRRVALSVLNCKSSAFASEQGGPRQLELELSAKSITSLAFNC